jgi:hypothetical protein
MPDLIVPYPLDETVRLPEVCARCGKPASGIRKFRVASPPSGLDTLFTGHDRQVIRNLECLLRSRVILTLPVCWWHRWIVPPNLRVWLQSETSIHVGGLSPEFAEAARRRIPGWRRA